jgi:hypothetical protein
MALCPRNRILHGNESSSSIKYGWISWLDEQLLAFKEGPCPAKLVTIGEVHREKQHSRNKQALGSTSAPLLANISIVATADQSHLFYRTQPRRTPGPTAGNPAAIPNVIIAGRIIHQIRSTADFMQPAPAQKKIGNLNPLLTNSISVQQCSPGRTAIFRTYLRLVKSVSKALKLEMDTPLSAQQWGRGRC